MKGHDLVELDFDKKEEIFTGFTVQKLSGFAFILQKLKMEPIIYGATSRAFFTARQPERESMKFGCIMTVMV